MAINRGISSFAFALVVGLSTSVTFAQAPDAAKQEAQKLYQDAAKDMETRAYGQACPKLEAARKIMPDHVRTAMSLAECYDKLGEPATALDVFEAARKLAHAQKNTDKLAEIDTKMAALRSRTPHLTISVPKKLAMLPGLSIARNGMPIPVAQWGTAVAINPGTYQFEVTALDKIPWNTSIDVQIGKNATLEIAPPWTAKSEGQDSTTAAQGSPLRTVGIVGVALGVVGIGTGAILGGLAVSKNKESDNGHCNANNVCDRIGFDLRTDARTIGNGSTAALFVGGVLLAGGVVLIAVSGRNKESGDKPQASLWMGPTSIGVRGRW